MTALATKPPAAANVPSVETAESPSAACARTSSAIDSPRPAKWTRERFEAALDAGVLADWRVEYIEGELIEIPAQKDPHAWSVANLDDWTRSAFGRGFHFRCQLPLRVEDTSEPEPDIAVIEGPLRRGQGHPTTAALVIEVSHETVRFDRRNARLYARANVPEYWLLNIPQRQLELHRQPLAGAAPDGPWYAEMRVLGEGDSVSPLAVPEATVTVRDLLP